MTVNKKTAEPIFREMKKEDLEEYLDLVEICFREGIESDRMNIPELRSLMKKLYRPFFKIIMKIMRMKQDSYIAEIDGKIVSGATLSSRKEEGTIGNVMTHPDYRRRGLARTLFRRATQRGIDLKLKKLDLSVHPDNEGAVKLYEAEGFKRNYHSGKFELDGSKITVSEKEQKEVFLKEITKLDPENMDEMLDECYPPFYFEARDREKFLKEYIPPRFIRMVAKRVVGQTINTYGIFVSDEGQPRGYLQTSQSRLIEGTLLRSPIIREQDNDLLFEVIPLLLQLETAENESPILVLSASMHRKSLIKILEEIGFTKKEEDLTMIKKLE